MIDFICCGVKYSKSDPVTYLDITSYKVKPVTKVHVALKVKNKIKKIVVLKEICEVLRCIKNGCTKIKVKRYGKVNGHYQLLEVEDLKNNIHTGIFDIHSRKEIISNPADEYLEETKKFREQLPQICPLKNVYYSKNIPLAYGKVLSPTTQRARYINEQGWADSKVLKFSIKTEKI